MSGGIYIQQKFPNEHQSGIHGTGSPANKLFKGGNK